MNQLTLFDYASLDTETSAFVQEKAQNIHARLKRTAEDIIAIGQDLIEVKERLGHGRFLPWLQSEFGMTERHARNFMHVAGRFGMKSEIISDLPVTILYELAAPSMPETVVEMVENGDVPPILSAIREAKQEFIQSEQASHVLSGFGRTLVNLDKPSTLPPTPVYQPAEPPASTFIPSYQSVYTPPAVREHVQEAATPVYTPPVVEYSPVHFVSPAQPSMPVPEPEQVEVEDWREIKRQQVRERLADLRANGVMLPIGKYSCLVVDPPWPMQKIERDVRPNQVEFDYPTMSEDELREFPLPDVAADDCHLYLWTTQKFLPMALRLAEHWGFKYQCLMTWVKNVGFTPFSWMYSTEHVLFCTRGSLPLLALGKRLDFRASVREHSRKPDEFYDLVREVSPGPRLDVFSREKRDGFEQFGNEVDKYVC